MAARAMARMQHGGEGRGVGEMLQLQLVPFCGVAIGCLAAAVAALQRAQMHIGVAWGRGRHRVVHESIVSVNQSN